MADAIRVSIRQDNIRVRIPVGQQGPVGPQGPAGGTAFSSFLAGENLSAGRAVILDGGQAFYFQPDDATHAGRLFGVTTSSALAGAAVSIQVGGVVTDAAFTGLDDATCWVGANGQITTTRPSSGVVQKVGLGLGSNMLLIDFSIQIIQS
jgi:hypothetical protein